MTPDSPAPQDPIAATEAAANEASETVRAAATDATANLETATAAVADSAESANQDGAKAAAAASRTATGAFDEARERLNAMASSLPGPAQELFKPFRAGGDALGKGLGSSYATAMEGMAEFNSKAIAAWRNNAESTIRHWQNLAAVKSLSEAISLSAEHTRQQLEAVTTQTRELSSLATRIVRDAADPLKFTGR